MTAKWKIEERPANISNTLKTNDSAKKRHWTMTYNVVAHPTKRSAKAKLINKNCERLRNFFPRSVAIVREFPTMIRKAITLIKSKSPRRDSTRWNPYWDQIPKDELKIWNLNSVSVARQTASLLDILWQVIICHIYINKKTEMQVLCMKTCCE